MSAPSPARLCIDCAHFRPRPWWDFIFWGRRRAMATCRKWQAQVEVSAIDPVTGRLVFKRFPSAVCIVARETPDLCGPDGAWWEPRTPPITRSAA